jgi:hypothetical protein
MLNSYYYVSPHWILKRYSIINGSNKYRLKHAVKNYRCHNCLSILFKEIHKTTYDYPYACLICDENMFNFEVIKTTNGREL